MDLARRKGVGFAKTVLGTIRKPSKVHKARVFCNYEGCRGVPMTFCANCGKYFCESHLSRSALFCTQLFCPTCNPKPILCNHDECEIQGWRMCDQCGGMYCPQHLKEVSNRIGIKLLRCVTCIADPTRRADDVKQSKMRKVIEARIKRRAEIHKFAQEIREKNIPGKNIWFEDATVVVFLPTKHTVYIKDDGSISVLPPGELFERMEPTEMLIYAIRKVLTLHLYSAQQGRQAYRKPKRRI